MTVDFYKRLSKRETSPHHDLRVSKWFTAGWGAVAVAFASFAALLDNLIEAVMLGATAHVVVDGEWNDDLMMQVVKPEPIT